MERKGHSTGFYLEALVLITVFLAVILVLTQIFGLGRLQSRRAGTLTDAVCLAQNAAEAVSASHSAGELLSILDRGGNASGDERAVNAAYGDDMAPDPDGLYRVNVTWEPDEADPGFVRSVITVTAGNDDTPVYVLETAVDTGVTG